MFLNNNRWPNVLMLDWELALYRLQLWRLITPFFYLGPVGLNFFLTAQFMWTYMSQLEKLHYREPHTFAMLLMFGIGRCVRSLCLRCFPVRGLPGLVSRAWAHVHELVVVRVIRLVW